MFQEISNGRTHGSRTPKKTWVSNSSVSRNLLNGVRWEKGPIQFLMDMDVSKNSGTPKSSILIGFSMIFTIHFGVYTPIFWKHPNVAFGEGGLPSNDLVTFNFLGAQVPSLPGSQVLGLRCPEGQETPGENF